ncbi:hypothetical protein ABFS82_01G008700 [Erythranthe guttata]
MDSIANIKLAAPNVSMADSSQLRKMGADVIITIHDNGKDSKFPIIPDSPPNDRNHKLSLESNDSTRKSVTTRSCPSPEISGFCPSPIHPPRTPRNLNLTRVKSFSRSVHSKPKSRFGEQSIPIESTILEDGALVEDYAIAYSDSVRETNHRAVFFSSPKTPFISSPPGRFGELDEDEEIYMKIRCRRKIRFWNVKTRVLIEWLLFLFIMGCLVVSLTVDKFKNWRIWDLRIWRWFMLVLVTCSGLLFTEWVMRFVVLLIELNYLLRKKVLYFVYGLKKSVQVCIWLALVLLNWVFLIEEGVKQSRVEARILSFITWTIASLLIGAFFWLLKTLLLKILASSFHVNTFFDRIQDSIFHQYILMTLSGPPFMEPANIVVDKIGSMSKSNSYIARKGKEDMENLKRKEFIDINKLHQMKQNKVSAWTMKMLVDVIHNSGLTTLSNEIDEINGDEEMDKEITNEEEAIAAAYHIFRHIAQPGSKYIDELDLSRFMIKEELEIVFPMIDVAETGRIDRKTLTDWVVKVYKGRKALAHALTDTKTAVKQLNKLVTGILIVIMIVLWLSLTGIATTKVLVLLSSQLVLSVFVFGNTCKTIFEAIIFVFVMHPFDVGDRCVIDGVQMIVEEMNILTTVFLRYDNEKIYYPNSVLSAKPISNFYRSPDMGDLVEFSIDFKTPLEKIGALKEKIKMYLMNNPQHWHPNHNVVVKEIVNVNKIKMGLYINHTMNFQDYGEKSRRKTQMILEMKRIFEELNIRYDLLPQQVHLLDKDH